MENETLVFDLKNYCNPTEFDSIEKYQLKKRQMITFHKNSDITNRKGNLFTDCLQAIL